MHKMRLSAIAGPGTGTTYHSIRGAQVHNRRAPRAPAGTPELEVQYRFMLLQDFVHPTAKHALALAVHDAQLKLSLRSA